MAIPVYESSKKPGEAKITQHVMLIEPNGGTMAVAENCVFPETTEKRPGITPTPGLCSFRFPPQREGKVDVNVLAPGGLPIRRAADPAGKPNTFKVDFPIKPGQSEIRLEWQMPFTSPGVFENTILVAGAPELKLLAPAGVTLTGDGVAALGKEPTTGATVYGVAGTSFHINVEGSGTLRTDSGGDANNGSPSVTENMPRLFGLTTANGNPVQPILAVKWILASVLGMLAIGFALLYRKGNPIK